MEKFSLKIIVITAFLFISAYATSQTYVYLDENSKEISLKDFKKKCGNQLYKCLTYTKDSIALSQVLYKYKFGKISPQEYEQLRKLLIKDAAIEIQPNKIIVIKKYDKLYSYVNLPVGEKGSYNKRKIEVDSLNNVTSPLHRYSFNSYNFKKEVFDKIVSNWVMSISKCKEKYEEKFNVKIIHLHTENSTLEKEYINFKWLKDRGIFKNIFFTYPKLHNTLILKPDGEYFLSNSNSNSNNNTEILKTLLKNSDWTTYRKDYEKSLYEISKGEGLFKHKPKRFYGQPCF